MPHAACHSSRRKKTMSPAAAAPTAHRSTAPAAASFTTRIIRLWRFWAKSQSFSTAVFMASAPVTRAMASTKAAHSPRVRGSWQPKNTT